MTLAASWCALVQRSLVGGTIVLLLVAAVWWPLRRRAPAQLGYGLFLLVLLQLALPLHLLPLGGFGPLLPRARLESWLAEAPALGGASDAAQPAHAQLPRAHPALEAAAPAGSAALWLLLGWAAVAALLLGRLARAQQRTARLVRDARPLDPARLPFDYAAACRRMGLRRPVELRETRALSSPAVAGLRRPCVLLPRGLRRELAPAQLEFALLHELAHVRRGDLRLGLVQRLIGIAYFFHPAVWIASRIVDEQREFACDDAALAASTLDRRACGQGFVRIAEWAHDRRPVRAAALGMLDKPMNRRRLMRILDARRRPTGRTSFATRAFVLAVGLLVLPAAEAVRAQEPQAPRSGGSELAELRARLERVQRENDELRARLRELERHGPWPATATPHALPPETPAPGAQPARPHGLPPSSPPAPGARPAPWPTHAWPTPAVPTPAGRRPPRAVAPRVVAPPAVGPREVAPRVVAPRVPSPPFGLPHAAAPNPLLTPSCPPAAPAPGTPATPAVPEVAPPAGQTPATPSAPASPPRRIIA